MENLATITPKKLSFGKKLRFGIGDFGMSIIIACLQFYMLFYYTDVVGIDPAVAGSAVLVGKITWDMINDVLFGYLVDKTKTRWGRRRPYLMFGAIPLALSFWLLLSLPSATEMSDLGGFFAILGTFIVYDSFGTLVNTSYSAMTAELTTDYNERTSLATTRMVFNVIGYILGAGLTTILAVKLQNIYSITLLKAWSYTGLIFGAFAAITIMIPGFSKDLKPVVDAEPTKMPPLSAMFSTLKNKPFVKFVTVNAIMSTAFTLVTTMLPYFLKYQLVMDEGGQSLVMLLMLVTLGLCLVPCKKLADHIGKAKTYAIGLMIACAALMVAFFLPHSTSSIIFGVAIVAGIGFSSQWVCPHSMMPDVIEYDELETGERREGIYYGMWGLLTKITGALGSAMCGWGLKISNYNADLSVQPESALFGIRILFTIMPIFFLLICMPLLFKYPINSKVHAELMEKLAAKRAGESK